MDCIIKYNEIKIGDVRMWLPASVVILGIVFFICIVNFYFSKVEYKNKTQWKKYNVFKSPTAWKTYAICIAIAIGILFMISMINIFKGYTSIGKQQDNSSQQQQTSTQ